MPPKRKKAVVRKPKGGRVTQRQVNTKGSQQVSVVIDQRKYTNKRTNQQPSQRHAQTAKDTVILSGPRSGGLYESALAPRQQNDLLATALLKTVGLLQPQNTLAEKTFKDSETQATRMTPDATITPASGVLSQLERMREFLRGNKDYVKSLVKNTQKMDAAALDAYINKLLSNRLQQLYAEVRTLQRGGYDSPDVSSLFEPPDNLDTLKKMLYSAENKFYTLHADEPEGEGGGGGGGVALLQSDDEGEK